MKTPPSALLSTEETIPAVKAADTKPTKPAGICSLTISEEERQGRVHDLQTEESRLRSQYIKEHTKEVPHSGKKVEFADSNNIEDRPCSNCYINNNSNNLNMDAVAPTATPVEASKM